MTLRRHRPVGLALAAGAAASSTPTSRSARSPATTSPGQFVGNVLPVDDRRRRRCASAARPKNDRVRRRSRSARSCSNGSPASSRCPLLVLRRASRSGRRCSTSSTRGSRCSIAGITLGAARSSCCSSPATRASRAASPSTRTGRGSSARCTSASTALRREPAPASFRVLGTAIVYQVSVVLIVRAHLPHARPAASRSPRVLAFVPAVLDAAGAPDLVQRARRARRRARAVPAPRSAITDGQAIAAGLLWYARHARREHARRAGVRGRATAEATPDAGADDASVSDRAPNARAIDASAAAATLRDGARPLLVGRDPRDPRLLPRVLGDPEREPGRHRPHAFHNAEQHHPAGAPPRHLPRGDDPASGRCTSSRSIIAANYFYGSLHFVVTIGVGVFLFRKFSDDYPRYRNTLGDRDRRSRSIGFTLFPLMPPRLLDLHGRRLRRSSTRSPSTRRSGRSTRARSARSRTSTRPCRACTSAWATVVRARARARG